VINKAFEKNSLTIGYFGGILVALKIIVKIEKLPVQSTIMILLGKI